MKMNSASTDTNISSEIQLVINIFNIFCESNLFFHTKLFHSSSFNLQHEIVSTIPLTSDTILIKF